MDDTLISTYGARRAREIWRDVLDQHPAELEGVDPSALVDAIVQTADRIWRDPPNAHDRWYSMGEVRRVIAHQSFQSLGLENQSLAEKAADAFTIVREREMELFDGAIETLEALKDEKIHLTLITNGSSISQRWKIERFDLTQHFDHIQIEEEAGYGKPHPNAYRIALERIGYDVGEVWMVGDNLEWDVGGPQKFGVTGVWFNGHAQEPDASANVEPDHVANSHAELRALFFKHIKD